jgi:hypothetical protein
MQISDPLKVQLLKLRSVIAERAGLNLVIGDATEDASDYYFRASVKPKHAPLSVLPESAGDGGNNYQEDPAPALADAKLNEHLPLSRRAKFAIAAAVIVICFAWFAHRLFSSGYEI